MRALALLALIPLAGCRPPKSVDFYRIHGIERDTAIHHCLASNSNSWDCANAITAESEKWDTRDLGGGGFTIFITDGPAPATPGPHS